MDLTDLKAMTRSVSSTKAPLHEGLKYSNVKFSKRKFNDDIPKRKMCSRDAIACHRAGRHTADDQVETMSENFDDPTGRWPRAIVKFLRRLTRESSGTFKSRSIQCSPQPGTAAFAVASRITPENVAESTWHVPHAPPSAPS